MSLLRTCSYVRANGSICKALAIKTGDLCRTHQLEIHRRESLHDAVTSRRCEMAKYAIGVTTIAKVPGLEDTFDDISAGLFKSLDLPPIEDANSLQQHLNAVI